MPEILYREPEFLWKENGRETIVGDLAWLMNDGGYLQFNIYGNTLEFLNCYSRDNKENSILDIMAGIQILNAAKSNSSFNALYIGNDAKKLQMFCSLLKILSAHHSAAINRCLLQNIAGNALRTFYGYSNNIKQSETSRDNAPKTNFFDIVIADANSVTNLRSEAVPYAKKTGIIVVFNDKKALYEKENISVNEGGGGIKYALWYAFTKDAVKADKTIIDIREHKKSKFVALIENLYNEIQYVMPQTFEDKLFLGNTKRILQRDINETDYTFGENCGEIRNRIKEIIEDLETLNTNTKIKNKLHKRLRHLLNMSSKSALNETLQSSSYEKSVEFILKNDLVPPGIAEYSDEKQKFNFYNWYWPYTTLEEDWLFRFITLNIPKRKKPLNFFTCHGDDLRSRFMKVENKIFFNMEDGIKRTLDSRDLCLPGVNLAISYSETKDEKAVFFPYWLTIFEPDLDITSIRNKIENINSAKSKAVKDCALISSHDIYQSRAAMLSCLGDVLEIKCPGKFNHNDDSLKTEFNDNKLQYLNQFKFYACPENTNALNYLTEKLFDAFKAGCIPIYYGCHNNPLPEYINRDAILFWQNGGDNQELLKTVVRLKNNDEAYQKFIAQEKLKKGFDEYVYGRFTELKNKLETLAL